MNPILILDCFIREKSEEEVLLNFLDKVKKLDKPVFLVSNSILSEEIQKRVNFFFYDKRNNLFSQQYTNVNKIFYWTDYGDFMVYDTLENLQKHGLSVLINLYNSIKIVKELGYTHFIKMEYDATLGDVTLDKMNELLKTEKKAVFFEEKGDIEDEGMSIIVHFFFSEIEFFLNNFWIIDSEETYRKFLIEKKKNLDFLTMERFLWFNSCHIDKTQIEVRNDFHELFHDSIWNHKQTKTGYDEKYQNCISKIYLAKKQNIDLNQKVIFTKNLKEGNELRRIVGVFGDGSRQEYFHHVDGNGSWTYNLVPYNIEKILVFRDDIFLYEDYLSDGNTKIEFK